MFLLHAQGAELNIFAVDKAFSLIFPFRSHPHPDVRSSVASACISFFSLFGVDILNWEVQSSLAHKYS